MITKSWMYDAIIYVYALSLLFYFSDFVGRKQSAKRMGTGLLLFAWALQTALLVIRWLDEPSLGLFSMFETLLFLSWIIVTGSLLIHYFLNMDLIVFFLNVIGFAIAALNFFSDEKVLPTSSHWKVSDELLFIHVSLAIGSYAAYLIGAVLSGMYIFLHIRLKEKSWSRVMQRFPSLEKIEAWTFYTAVVGTPLLIMSLALGIDWIFINGNHDLLWDPKVLNSSLIIAAYAFYLFQRLKSRSSGDELALWNFAAFGVVVLNYIVSNMISSFHQWIWM